MLFTRSHEWIVVEGKIATVGISSFVQKELGEIVYVEFPEIGKELAKDQEACVLESTKAAADIYSPISGTVVDINRELIKDISLLNRDPEGKGWLFRLEMKNLSELYTNEFKTWEFDKETP